MEYFSPILPLALSLVASVEALPQVAPRCSHNNCLRAVIAGSFPNRPTQADCSSFLRKTVTPAAYTQVATELETITVLETVDVATQTITATVTADPAIIKRDNGIDQQEKRQVTVHPSVMPTYATACRSVEAYSSACSCIGISPTTVTEATPTVTVTSTSIVTASTTIGLVETVTTTGTVAVTDTESRTVTATTTKTVVAFPPWETFVVRAVGGRVNGQFVYSWQYDSNRNSFFQAFTSRAGATQYHMSSPASNALMTEQNTRFGALDVSRAQGAFGATWMADVAIRQRDSLVALGCHISEDDWELKCAYNADQNSWRTGRFKPGFETLRNARLVCRDWDRAASSHLFRILHLKYGSACEAGRALFTKWHHTVDLEVVKCAARRVIIDAAPKQTFAGPPDEIPPGWAEKAEAMFDLSNLNAVEIHLGRNCPDEQVDQEPDYWNHWVASCEDRVTRQNGLKAVFRAIQGRKLGGQERSTVTCRALNNLQSITDKEFEASSLFQSVIVDIRQLHLHVKYEHDEDGINYDFETDLQAGLLSSLSSQLTALTLSFNQEWGTMPGVFSGSGLHFPSLQTLRLRFFTISHDSHFDWVLRMPALKALYLSQTRIMTHAAVKHEFIHTLNLQIHNWERLPLGAYGFKRPNYVFFTYCGR
ncbi:uncharacterized protein J7T54_004512 [Emericellopsis cladophorae]|uniref:Uncharacterized protein n=1 Tax=Emericellopsis cladophorae TaxID=2686198 RepID=A0A9Q0BBT8_9HYPO|nr:uncharacterized protein J7T54_004512 [Emericellopsis cladophorae]KAI6779016.1 hypothetical protein J7T54_004512 [Emericellopsis cladophorae]